MACNKPIEGWRRPDGAVTFDRKQTTGPWNTIRVPCGQCAACRLTRTYAWALRLIHESSLHETNSFLTLTYDDSHLPANGCLDKTAFPTFARALRKRGIQLRYYHCGEYGGRYLRPHYHAAIFGQDWHEDRHFYKTKNGFRLFNSPLLDAVWKQGYVVIGDLTLDSAAYIARYITKDQRPKRLGDLTKEYATMSRRPGIAAGWIDRWHRDVYMHDYVIAEGKKFRPPKYYDSRYELTNTDIKQLRQSRRAHVLKSKPSSNYQRTANERKLATALNQKCGY